MESNRIVKSLKLHGALLLLLIANNCWGINNPSATYCETMGYTYVKGGECLFPDNTQADAWNFYRGKEKQEFSYCVRKGYNMETEVVDKEGYTQEIPVCVPRKGNSKSIYKIPMLELMQQNGDELEINDVSSGYNTEAPFSAERIETTDIKSLPASFDWRNYNGHSYIGSVRDQGHCGACYAYAAAASAEGVYNYSNNKFDGSTINLSEDYIAFCLGKYGPYSSHFSGCNGADYDYAELTAATIEGYTDEAHYPSTNTDPGSCNYRSYPTTKYKTWGRLGVNNDYAIKNAIMTYGVIDVAVYVTNAFQSYSSGVFTNSSTSCPNGAYTTTNHAVSLVGWGTDTGGLYWILRNSWSSRWGENGYMRIRAHAARVACSATYLQYASAPVPTPNRSISPVISYLLSSSSSSQECIAGSTWNFTWDWHCDGSVGTGPTTYYANHTTSDGSTWSLLGNHYTETFSNGTVYTGTINSACSYMQGTMLESAAEGGSTGCWHASLKTSSAIVGSVNKTDVAKDKLSKDGVALDLSK